MSRAERARPEKVRSDPDLQKNICRNADVVTFILECCSVMTPEIKMKRALLGGGLGIHGTLLSLTVIVYSFRFFRLFLSC